MGKTLIDSRADIQQAIDIAYYAAAEGTRLLGHTTTSEKSDKFAFTLRLPIGVVALITPWNFPITIPARKIFYSLVCGNTIVFKPSSEAPQCAIELIEILEKAGIPKGIINLVTGPGDVIGSAFTKHKKVRMISFCGHKDTGTKIMSEAGVKRVSLELGGKNPLIIMDDADLDLAVKAVVCGGYSTTGQRCTASSRVIVHNKIKSTIEKMVIEQIKKLKLGNGLEPRTDVGPLVNKKAQNKMQEYCQIGVNEGAKLLLAEKFPKDSKAGFLNRLFLLTVLLK